MDTTTIATLANLALISVPMFAIAFALLLSLVDALDNTLPSYCDATDSAPSFSFNGSHAYVAPVANKSLVRAMLALDVDDTCVATAKLARLPRNVITPLDAMQAQVLEVCAACWTAPNDGRPCMLPQAPNAEMGIS